MHSLFIYSETFSNGYNVEILYLFFIFSILSGIFVIISKNPIISVLFLISLFLNIACYLITLGMAFIGLSYLLVYVGAVSILFLFILMLINVRISELLSDTGNSIPISFIIGLSFTYPVSQILPYNISGFDSKLIGYTNVFNDSTDYSTNKENISYVSGKIWDASLAESDHINSLGNIMYTSYSMWLIITSIILLLAMVGAIVITIKQKS